MLNERYEKVKIGIKEINLGYLQQCLLLTNHQHNYQSCKTK